MNVRETVFIDWKFNPILLALAMRFNFMEMALISFSITSRCLQIIIAKWNVYHFQSAFIRTTRKKIPWILTMKRIAGIFALNFTAFERFELMISSKRIKKANKIAHSVLFDSHPKTNSILLFPIKNDVCGIQKREKKTRKMRVQFFINFNLILFVYSNHLMRAIC